LVGQWQKQGNIKVYYYAPGNMTLGIVRANIKLINPDRIYLNSMFSNMFIPLWLAYKVGNVIIAPRGMLKASALAHKPLKKNLYCLFLRILDIDKYVSFHAADAVEEVEIRKIFPLVRNVIIAPNIPIQPATVFFPLIKQKGYLRILFSARLHPIKNLSFLLTILNEVEGEVELVIAVIQEDPAYCSLCMKLAENLPKNVKVAWHFDLTPSEVLQLIQQVHLFVLPTKGESFGHSIYEALSVGCPVLISDQTPWRKLLESESGMDLPLVENLFLDAIHTFVNLEDSRWQEFRQGALLKAKQYVEEMQAEYYYDKLFTS
jgi:glycosyltransferase involved in cell wall biosynthesis